MFWTLKFKCSAIFFGIIISSVSLIPEDKISPANLIDLVELYTVFENEGMVENWFSKIVKFGNSLKSGNSIRNEAVEGAPVKLYVTLSMNALENVDIDNLIKSISFSNWVNSFDNFEKILLEAFKSCLK
eukprot:NODE_21_length_42443_cov_0.822808.p35 type:complete len:129 gc:universal NODE_21_length_42443_cov_0.822808:37596-37210(-)